MQEHLSIGIDVAKAHLAIGVVDHSELNSLIGNTAPDIKRWLRDVPQGSRIAVESTGGYHSLVVQLAQEEGFATYVLNARDVHFYAKALGQRGKTDRTDAQVISRYLKEHHGHLHEFRSGGCAERDIDQLLHQRALLVRQRDALRLSQEVRVLSEPIRALIEQFNNVLAVIDEQMAARIRSEKELASDARRLQTIPGIGTQGAAMLTCLFRRIGFQSIDAVIAFSGLDPRPMDSGQTHGKRKLSKRGPCLLRRQLFMMAFAASRTKAFKPYYQALRARGFSSTASFVILGRKLLAIAFAIWRSQSSFDPQRLVSKTTAGTNTVAV